jgi:protease IV
MFKNNSFIKIIVIVLAFIGFFSLLKFAGKNFSSQEHEVAPHQSILHLELRGVILNGKKFLETLKSYEDDKNIKALLVTIDSPGGSVGPSQEINAEINRFKKKLNIPVVCQSSGLMASGAYYSAVACDKIVVAAGALVGSIGVIMEFANLEKLYDWARVSRSSITSGKYKDSGAEYRSMREDEKALFQDLINEVYLQFKEAVALGRPELKKENLETYTDGRVFTGAKAVELGFADQIGGYQDAVQLAKEIAQLPESAEVYEPPKPQRSIFDWQQEEDSLNSLIGSVKNIFKVELLNRPLYLMPGAWEKSD